MEIAEKLYLGDIVQMRKPHPCGGNEWEIVRVGADIGLMCRTCGRRVLMPRRQFARQAKRFIARSPAAEPGLAAPRPSPIDQDEDRP